MRRAPSILALCVAFASPAGADTGAFSDRPDAHAPIGVMGDHTHAAGDLMLSYRYTRMRMQGNRSSTRDQSVSRVLQDFPVSPTDMDVDVHLWGAMFAPHDAVTLAAMLPFVSKQMGHRRRDGVTFETRSHDLGDVRASALVKLWQTEGHRVHLNAGLSFPTGAIGEEDSLPAPAGRQQLPYPMQIGSGSWDLLPGITYVGHAERLSWGGQAIGVIRTGRNREGYRLGHRAEVTTWLAHPLTPWLSLSARAAWLAWTNLRGADAAQDPTLVPTADPKRRAGHRLDLLAGVNLLVPLHGRADRNSHRLAIEAGFPAYQWLDGPQLESDWRVTVGWQKAFHWTF